MQMRRFIIFSITAFLSFVIAHGTSFAQSGPDWKNPNCTQVAQDLQAAQTYHAQQLSQNTTNFYAYLTPIDLSAYQCLTQLSNILDQLQSISSLGIGAILSSWIENQVASIITQGCNVVAGSLSKGMSLIYGQINNFCIPLPSIGLNIPSPSIPSAPPCKGTSLFTLNPTHANTTGNSTIWDYENTGPGGSKPVIP